MIDPEVRYRVFEILLVAKSIKKNVLSEKATIDRDYKLRKATFYGLRFKIETLLVVSTTLGDVKIRSILFYVGEKNVVLKGKINIPIASIKEVEFVL
jgi:hypothetical protein